MTELSFAYGPLSGSSNDSPYDSFASIDNDEQPKKQPPKPVVQSTKIPQQTQQIYDSQSINSQYDQEQKLMNILNQIKQQKNTQQTESQSYIDKLYSKRKELWKAIQISFIIILALSLHFIIDHYLKLYITNTDLSFERELFIRLLYPISILFILWNLKTFVK
jgi:hypothetical protein